MNRQNLIDEIVARAKLCKYQTSKNGKFITILETNFNQKINRRLVYKIADLKKIVADLKKFVAPTKAKQVISKPAPKSEHSFYIEKKTFEIKFETVEITQEKVKKNETVENDVDFVKPAFYKHVFELYGKKAGAIQRINDIKTGKSFEHTCFAAKTTEEELKELEKSKYLFSVDDCNKQLIGTKLVSSKQFVIVNQENREKFATQNKGKTCINEHFMPNAPTTFVSDFDDLLFIDENDRQNFIKSFSENFRQTFDKVYPNYKESKFKHIWLTSDKKMSKHKHAPVEGFHIITHARFQNKSIGFEDFGDQLYFWKEFAKNKLFEVDLAIYKTRSLRCIFSTKFPENRPIYFLNDSVPVWQTFGNQNVAQFLPKINPIQKTENLPLNEISAIGSENWNEVKEILRQSNPIDFSARNKWVLLNFMLKAMFGMNGLILSGEFFARQWNLKCDIESNETQFKKIEPTTGTSIERIKSLCKYKPDQMTEMRKFLRDNQTHSIYNAAMILSSKLGNKLSELDEYFKLNASSKVYERIKKLYDNPVFPGTYSQYDLDQIFEPKFRPNEIFEAEKITPEFFGQLLNKNNTILLKSGCGTGKSYNVFAHWMQMYKQNCEGNKEYENLQEVKRPKFLFITYRVSLGEDLCAKNQKKEFAEIRTGNYLSQIRTIDNSDIFTCQLESLHKFLNQINKFDLIVFDECEHLILQLNNIKKLETVIKTGNILSNLIKTKKTLWMSANLGQLTLNYIRSIKNYDFYYAINSFKDKNYTVIIESNWKDKILELVRMNKKIVIPTNSKRVCKFLEKVIKEEKPEYKILTITKEESQEKIQKNRQILQNVNEEFVKYDVVIYSPTIEAGVSFEIKHFDTIFGIFKTGSTNHLSQYQSLFRSRILTKGNNTIYLAHTHTSNKFQYCPSTKKELRRYFIFNHLIEPKHIETWNKIALEIETINGIEKEFVELDKPIFNAVCANIAFEKYSQTNLLGFLCDELEDSGCKIINKYVTDEYTNEIIEKMHKNADNSKIMQNLTELSKFYKSFVQVVAYGIQRETFTGCNDLAQRIFMKFDTRILKKVDSLKISNQTLHKELKEIYGKIKNKLKCELLDGMIPTVEEREETTKIFKSIVQDYVDEEIKELTENTISPLSIYGFDEQDIQSAIKKFKTREHAKICVENFHSLVQINKKDDKNSIKGIIQRNDIVIRYELLKFLEYDYTDNFRIKGFDVDVLEKIKTYFTVDKIKLFDCEILDSRYKFKKNYLSENDTSKALNYFIRYINAKLEKYCIKLVRDKYNPIYTIEHTIYMPKQMYA